MSQTYHVHIYREMRLTFTPIRASSPQEAADRARQLPTDDAASIDDCNGTDLAALVDLDGDADYEQSVSIDFEDELRRKAARDMHAALKALLAADALAEASGARKWEFLDHALRLARDAVAQANGFLAASVPEATSPAPAATGSSTSAPR